jgi:nicotianamine synthase
MGGVVSIIRRIHDELAAAPSLRPGPHVDRLFRDLVELVLTTPPPVAAAALADPEIVELRPRLVELSAQGEYELEVAWAERITTSRAPGRTLARFPYADNYRALSRLERRLLQAAAAPPRRTLFVGAGPLPLSALLLATHLDTTVVCVDRDAGAVELAEAVAARLDGVGSRLIFRHGDVVARDDLADYDLVVVAALVGLTAETKRHVLQSVRRTMAPGALLVARSAHGLRTLLYPAVAPSDLAGYDLLSTTHPPAPVINSVIVARWFG